MTHVLRAYAACCPRYNTCGVCVPGHRCVAAPGNAMAQCGSRDDSSTGGGGNAPPQSNCGPPHTTSLVHSCVGRDFGATGWHSGNGCGCRPPPRHKWVAAGR